MKKQLLINTLLILILSTAFTSTHQIMSTSLRVTVRNDLGNVVENASVTLYATEDDYLKRENPVTETVYTNSKGEARFKNLQPIIYFVDVKTDEQSNDDGGVKTQKLENGKINRTTIVIF